MLLTDTLFLLSFFFLQPIIFHAAYREKERKSERERNVESEKVLTCK